MRISQLLHRDIYNAADLYMDGFSVAPKVIARDVPDQLAISALTHPDSIWWTIIGDDDKLLGLGGFERLDWVSKIGEPYIAIEENYRSKGLGYKLGKYMLDEALNTLKLRRIQTIILEVSPAVPILEKLGFEKEGTLKEIRKYKDAWVDAHIYAYLKRSS